MVELPDRLCEICGDPYTPARETSRYCSRSCQIVGRNRAQTKPPLKKTCAACGSEFETKSKKIRCCSRRCGRTIAEQTIDKAAFSAAVSAGKTGRTHNGVPHTDETKRVLSQKAYERMADPLRNPFIGKKRSLESREKQSKTRSERFVDGTYAWKTWAKAGNVLSSKLGRDVFCRSSWEKRAVKILDEDALVAAFEEEPLSIPYYRQEGDRRNLRHYVPDFLITYADGKRSLVEVKPACHIEADVNVAKFAAAREVCAKNGWNFEIWTQERLGIS